MHHQNRIPGAGGPKSNQAGCRRPYLINQACIKALDISVSQLMKIRREEGRVPLDLGPGFDAVSTSSGALSRLVRDEALNSVAVRICSAVLASCSCKVNIPDHGNRLSMRSVEASSRRTREPRHHRRAAVRKDLADMRKQGLRLGRPVLSDRVPARQSD